MRNHKRCVHTVCLTCVTYALLFHWASDAQVHVTSVFSHAPLIRSSVEVFVYYYYDQAGHSHHPRIACILLVMAQGRRNRLRGLRIWYKVQPKPLASVLFLPISRGKIITCTNSSDQNWKTAKLWWQVLFRAKWKAGAMLQSLWNWNRRCWACQTAHELWPRRSSRSNMSSLSPSTLLRHRDLSYGWYALDPRDDIVQKFCCVKVSQTMSGMLWSRGFVPISCAVSVELEDIDSWEGGEVERVEEELKVEPDIDKSRCEELNEFWEKRLRVIVGAQGCIGDKLRGDLDTDWSQENSVLSTEGSEMSILERGIWDRDATEEAIRSCASWLACWRSLRCTFMCPPRAWAVRNSLWQKLQE